MSGAQVRQAMARELADAWQAGHRQEVQCVLDTCPTIAWICSDHPLMEGMRWSPEEDRMIRKYFYLGYSRPSQRSCTERSSPSPSAFTP